jgi:hypothetical protein
MISIYKSVKNMKNYKQLLFLTVLFVLTGCDAFFAVGTTVIDSETGEPIEGAKATMVLDRGVEEADVIRYTDPNGQVGLAMNEHISAWTTLTVEKSGYQTWETQFRGKPTTDFVIRLKPIDK